jgi:UDP-N-acetylmuramyl pentapeptide phosphotransferase/UDP-N-acetylglucosamine-1-phosphate transferase
VRPLADSSAEMPNPRDATFMNALDILATVLAACALSAFLIAISYQLLYRYALARPNARSSHHVPTPQGGGAAVILATLATVLVAGNMSHTPIDAALVQIFATTLLVGSIGAWDDLRPIPVLPRLFLQALAVSIVIGSLDAGIRLIPIAPVWAERALLLIGALWFINLVNFMDGLDWMTVAEVIPVTAALTLFGYYGYLPPGPALVALALCGAMIGFAPFNRPVAKLFLGDVGSLPIGLLTGWCLLQLAASGHLAAALLLPLYYLADATVTLARRMFNGEQIWTAHRSHFYQRATDNGFSVMQVVGEVFVLNVVLAVLAALSIWLASPYAGAMMLALGASGVALVLNRFSRRRRSLA